MYALYKTLTVDGFEVHRILAVGSLEDMLKESRNFAGERVFILETA